MQIPLNNSYILIISSIAPVATIGGSCCRHMSTQQIAPFTFEIITLGFITFISEVCSLKSDTESL
ncbi:hypothetical protein HZS_5081 [Henneguya salminicola]|nr:hypothetical protein HZS_5081 [Henneguya salminicola]